MFIYFAMIIQLGLTWLDLKKHEEIDLFLDY